MNKETESVRFHYQKIEEISERLNEGISIHDIDELIPLTEKLFEHQSAIKKRIETIEKLIKREDT